MTWVKLLSGIVGLFNALTDWFEREQAKAAGAAIQRDIDLRAENDRIAKADIAGDAAATSGVSVEADPFNRDSL